MIQMTFENDGKISVFIYENGDSISVKTDINKLQSALPATHFEEIRNRCAAFVDMTRQNLRLAK